MLYYVIRLEIQSFRNGSDFALIKSNIYRINLSNVLFIFRIEFRSIYIRTYDPLSGANIDT